MQVNATEAEAANDDGTGTNVVPDVAAKVLRHVRHDGQADDQAQSHGHLSETPCPSKVAGTHLFVDVHLEAVMVSPIKNAVNPGKNDVAAGGAPNGRYGKNAEAGHDEASLREVLPGNAAFRGLTQQKEAKGQGPQCPSKANVDL